MKTQEITTPITDAAQAIQERLSDAPGMDQLKAIASKAIDPFQIEEKHSIFRPRNIIIGGIALGAAGIAYTKKFAKQAPFGESAAHRRATLEQDTGLSQPQRGPLTDVDANVSYPVEDQLPGGVADIDQTEAREKQDSF